MVERGYKFPWELSPPPTSVKPLGFDPPRDPLRYKILDLEVQSLLAKGAISPVTNPSPGFYARLFTVPKKTGDWRPVLDLSHLNRYLKKVPFKMDSVRDIRLDIQPGDWAASVDLKDAYFHVLIHPDRRPFLRFVWQGQTFQFLALPFGLSLAPFIFTKVTTELAALLRMRGIRFRMYLDDWLVLASGQAGCQSDLLQVLSLTRQLGFNINLEKSDLTPSQSFQYLGVRFDTRSFQCCPTERRIVALTDHIRHLMSQQDISLRQCLKVLGSMESMAGLLPLARCYKRPLQREVRSKFPNQQDLDARVENGPWLEMAVRQWLDDRWIRSTVPIRPLPPQLYLYTDASAQGWGAHCHLGEIAGLWAQTQTQYHINYLELMAVWLALKHFQDRLAGSWVTVVSDNVTSLAYIRNQGGTNSLTLSILAEELLIWCHHRSITLTTEFVPGKLNVIADQLSRGSQILPTEWTISHQALLPLWQVWEKPHIDLFATEFNARLPVYISPVRDERAFAQNAFSLSWENMSAYAYPPTALIPKVLAKFRLDRPSLILITPGWPKRPWFSELLQLSHEKPRPLCLKKGALLQPRSGISHPNVGILALTAWKLCGQDCAHKA